MKLKKKSAKVKNDYWSFPEMNSALEVALYYGFNPQEPIKYEHKAKSAENEMLSIDEKSAMLKHYVLGKEAQVPFSIATAIKPRERGKKLECSFDILGTMRPIADAIVIKAAYDTVVAEGFENPIVEINSIGDRESFARFNRDLAAYYKKHAGELDQACRQTLKKSPLEVMNCKHSACAVVHEESPHPMNYLSEPSRAHFAELLELLEITGIPYVINNCLVDNASFALHTVFHIYSNDSKNELLAYGSRWGTIAKKLGFRKDVPSVSATVHIKKPAGKSKTHKFAKPKLYFIQMGHEAKLKSLKVLDILRRSKIPVYHSLIKDKLGAQLSTAENFGVPYVLIMGQKESVENTILVRELANRSQETIKIIEVTSYLKKILP